MDCLFCKIIAGEIPSQKLYEDDKILVFRDIQPKAPVHFLAVPKIHIQDADAVTPENAGVVAHIFTVIPQLAKEQGLTGGYRIISNCGPDARQSVGHLHFHVLGGHMLSEDMG